MDITNSPAYLQAADIHNIGASSPSFFSDPIGATADAVSSAAEHISNIPNFAITSIASGINSIYNTGVAAGNFFGLTDEAQNDVTHTLAGFDTNLAQYYTANKQLADVGGFLATSLLPGMAGVKIFNAGQRVLSGALEAGTVGRTLAEATGLIPTVNAAGETLATVAGKALAEGQQTFSWLNQGVLKAIAGGVAQSVWEGAAFETMVQATMQKSPILEGQDYRDVASNILMGGLTSGVVGGLIHTAQIRGQIKGMMDSADRINAPFKTTASQAYLDNSPASQIVTHNFDIINTPVAETAGQTSLVTQRIQNAYNGIRTAFRALTGGDGDLGNIIADNMQGVDPDLVSKTVAGANQIARPGVKMVAGENEVIGNVTLHGENVGKITYDPVNPNDLTLADKVNGGREAVDRVVARFASKFTPDGKVKPIWGSAGDLWSPVTASGMDEIEARYIWAQTTAKYTDGMTISSHDIPLQEGALQRGVNVKIQEIDQPFGPYEVNAANLKNEVIRNKQALVGDLGKAKDSLWGFGSGGGAAQDLKTGVTSITSGQIARAANVSVKAIENTVADGSSSSASMFARQDAQAAYDAMRQSKNLKGGESNLDYIPQHAQVKYDTSGMADMNGNARDAYTMVQTQQKLAQDAVNNVVAGIAGKEYDALVHPGSQFALNVNRSGAGPGILTYANGGYGTAASWAEQTGAVTSRIMTKLQNDRTAITESAFNNLRANQQSAIAFSKLNDTLASTSEKYILKTDGSGLISQRLADYQAKVQAGVKGLVVPVLQEGAPDTIPFFDKNVANGWMAHMEANGYWVNHNNNLTSASIGVQSGKNADVAYPVRPDPKTMKYFAFVKDPSVVGQGMGHTSMIHAASEADLANMIDMARARTGYTVYTKDNVEDFKRAMGEYDYDKTLHDNYMDATLKSNGINNQFFPKTDPNKIMDAFDAYHSRQANSLARETVATKFSNELDQLQSLSEQFNSVAASKYKTTMDQIENTVKNPYNDYRKTALNISKLGEYPFLSAMNRTFSDTINGTVQRIMDAFDASKSVNDLQNVNDMLEKAGINSAYKSAAEVILANHSAPQQYVGNFIRGANSILQNLHLRLDFLNPIHVTAASQVLLGHEIPEAVRSVMRGIGDTSVTVPGTTDSILAPLKLYANAQKNWLSRADDGTEAFYKANGWGNDIRTQTQQIHQDLSLNGTETPSQLNTILAAARDKAQALVSVGGKITGNDYAHSYNQFISADIARQISDYGIQNSLMTEADKLPFINTFVNRTHANTLASQRPLLFQGPIGQSLGLFQSYQFNVMQQMFRSVSEGSSKDAAMLLGLQGTMFGLNGMPGFNYINQHIIGENSDNPTHKDAYSALYGALGKTTGDWLMYGVPSNLLQTNIYSRGNINPRSLTIIPTAPQDVFAVADFAKAIGNIKNTVSKIAGGGDVWQSLLQGLEHNGLSRPLSGLAQTAQALGGNNKVFSTTNQGDVSFVNDFTSLATLSRLAGGKPLDEAHVADEMALHQAYQASDKARMEAATQAFKTQVIGNPSATPDSVGSGTENYLRAFVNNGGRAQDFNKQMLNMITRANTPRANQVMESLKGPYADRMKSFMGGTVEDLTGYE